MRLPVGLGLVALAMGAASLPVRPVAAQDTVPADRGVRVGITYTPGLRPGLLVLGGSHNELLDSVRTILQRDLDLGDRFELISLPGGDSLSLGVGMADPAGPTRPTGSTQSAAPTSGVNYPLYAALGADYAVNVLQSDGSAVGITVYDVKGAAVRRQIVVPVTAVGEPDFRLKVHRSADEVVRVSAGTTGIAATRIAFVQRDRIYRLDSDGAGLTPVSPAGPKALSPAWDPSGQRLVYTEFGQGQDRLYLLNLASAERHLIPPTSRAQNWTPVFSPDAKTLAFSRTNDEGTDVYTYNLASDCCLQRFHSAWPGSASPRPEPASG